MRIALSALLLGLTMVGGCGAAARGGAMAADDPTPRDAWSTAIVAIPPPPAGEKSADGEQSPLPRDYADDEFPRPLSREVAFAILLNTDTFATTAVGYAGSLSIQVEAFRALIVRDDAAAVFADLMRRARRPGQLYALCAFRLIAPEAYAREEPELVTAPDPVIYLDGCMGRYRPVREVVRSDEPYTVRMLPGETFAQLVERRGPQGAIWLYIAGGGFPELFRGRR